WLPSPDIKKKWLAYIKNTEIPDNSPPPQPTDLKVDGSTLIWKATGIDNAIGRFLKALKDAGLADNTIVVYSADNGYHMANRGLAGKWSHFEESIQVPMIIADPRVPKDKQGKVSSLPALNIDLPATFVDWAGLVLPERFDGRSLKPIVDGDVPKNWRADGRAFLE
ncbi:sulfatase-like hydrolase/transferase, partial [Akkermansiaceae bacterium]|nr:sulfatase-like hydrolase/transferase [Akkermansiaceae bacterium]